MYRITQLAQQFGLSRSTLLYYDRIGLLSPSGRSDAGYRQVRDRDRYVQEVFDLLWLYILCSEEIDSRNSSI